MDLDVIAELDPLTGLPRIDDRPPALRWIEALDHGPMPEFNAAGPQEVQSE
jgi:hypothetical protein